LIFDQITLDRGSPLCGAMSFAVLVVKLNQSFD